VMNTAMTDAKIGLSMKKRDIFMGSVP